MKELHVINEQYNSSSCFVCGLDNPYGLRARFFETHDQQVVALFTPDNWHQSYPGRLHGGITSTILDETIGRAIFCLHGDQTWGVTLELNVTFKKPVPLGCELRVIGRITSDTSRIFEAEGELVLPDGTIAATARGRYLKQSITSIAADAGEGFVTKEWGRLLDAPTVQTITI